MAKRTRRQGCRPKLLAGITIKSAKLPVAGCADENQAAVGNDGTADIRRPGFRDATLLQLVELAQGRLPTDIAGP